MASFNKKVLNKIAIIGIRKVKDPTLLASPDPTNVKKASQPNAITKIEINKRFIIKGISQFMFVQLSTADPAEIKHVPPIKS